MEPKPTYYEHACERCNRRLEDCECEPGFPYGVFDPEDFYGDKAKAAATRHTGAVKWFDRVKGYGFIIPDDGSAEVFVHYTAINGSGYRNLYDGDRVSYDLVDRGRGPQAQAVRPFGGAA